MTKVVKKYNFGTELGSFSPFDFLEEGLDEFLESGNRVDKIVSSVVKISIALELIIKNRLQEISPGLILDQLDAQGLQLIKISNLEGKLINPSKVKSVIIKTARFPILLERAEQLFKFGKNKKALLRLYNIRNELIHHESTVDILEVNILLTKYVLPFLEEFTKNSRILAYDKKRWVKLSKVSHDAFKSDLFKKVYFCANQVIAYSTSKIKTLLKGELNLEDTETPEKEEISCPACKKFSATLILGVDYDWNPDGVITETYTIMRCIVCNLLLDQYEIDYVSGNLQDFFSKKENAMKWGEIKELKNQYNDLENYI